MEREQGTAHFRFGVACSAKVPPPAKARSHPDYNQESPIHKDSSQVWPLPLKTSSKRTGTASPS
jgi:hypothetical protein